MGVKGAPTGRVDAAAGRPAADARVVGRPTEDLLGLDDAGPVGGQPPKSSEFGPQISNGFGTGTEESDSAAWHHLLSGARASRAEASSALAEHPRDDGAEEEEEEDEAAPLIGMGASAHSGTVAPVGGLAQVKQDSACRRQAPRSVSALMAALLVWLLVAGRPGYLGAWTGSPAGSAVLGAALPPQPAPAVEEALGAAPSSSTTTLAAAAAARVAQKPLPDGIFWFHSNTSNEDFKPAAGAPAHADGEQNLFIPGKTSSPSQSGESKLYLKPHATMMNESRFKQRITGPPVSLQNTGKKCLSFVHIPKTGGTSIERASQKFFELLYPNASVGKEQATKPTKKKAGYSLIVPRKGRHRTRAKSKKPRRVSEKVCQDDSTRFSVAAVSIMNIGEGAASWTCQGAASFCTRPQWQEMMRALCCATCEKAAAQGSVSHHDASNSSVSDLGNVSQAAVPASSPYPYELWGRANGGGLAQHAEFQPPKFHCKIMKQAATWGKHKRFNCFQSSNDPYMKLAGCSWWHFPPADDPILIKSYLECQTFCVVRHPVARLLSHWKWTGWKHGEACTADNFGKWVQRSYKLYQKRRVESDCHLIPMADYVLSGSGGAKDVEAGIRTCDHVLNFETMQEEMAVLMHHFNFTGFPQLPNVNGASGCRTGVEGELSMATEKLIKRWYQADYELFGYT